MQEILLKIKYFERGLSKTPKKVNFIFFFRTQSLLINKVIKNKRRLGLATSRSSGYKVHKNVFISYVLSDQVWWCNMKRFLNYTKNNTCKFKQANSWHHKLFHFHLLFRISKVRKRRGKIAKIWISWEQKELFRWKKKHFP